MANVSKLSIALTPELAASVHAAVETGEYASASEVVREALRGWNQHRAERAAVIDEIRKAWHEGINSGDPMDGEEFFAELEAELDARIAAQTGGTATAAD